jgi:hypothetical protein
MRASVLGFCVFMLFAGSGDANAEPLQNVSVSDNSQGSPATDSYREYILDLTQIAAQHDNSQIAKSVQHQLDIVEGVGLSTRVLKFFHTIPIMVDEAACLNAEAEGDKAPIIAAGCYGPAGPPRSLGKPRNGSVYDSQKAEWVNLDPIGLAEDTNRGVVMVRPLPISAETPVVLHEMLHAYHSKMMPFGFANPSILFYFKHAKNLYPSDAYLMTNEREVFAVTASVFLFGKDNKEPFTRSNLKEKQPDYFKYLVWLFGFDPDHPLAGSPVASVN